VDNTTEPHWPAYPLSVLGQGGPYPSTWARPLSTIKDILSLDLEVG
jgi:hypothetical protein